MVDVHSVGTLFYIIIKLLESICYLFGEFESLEGQLTCWW